VNPFRCKLLPKKRASVVGDERNASLFSETERRAGCDARSWTRVVEERSTEFEGNRIDLLRGCGECERLVLKPNDDYGGRGSCWGGPSQREMEDAIREAIDLHTCAATGRDSEEPFPRVDRREARHPRPLLDTAPYVSHGRFVEGCLTRISTDELLNVTAGAARTYRQYWWRRDEVRTEAPVSHGRDRGEYQMIDPRRESWQGGIRQDHEIRSAASARREAELHQCQVEVGTRVCQRFRRRATSS